MDTLFFVHEGNAFGTRMCQKKGKEVPKKKQNKDSFDST